MFFLQIYNILLIQIVIIFIIFLINYIKQYISMNLILIKFYN